MFDYTLKYILYSDFVHLVYNSTLIKSYIDDLLPEKSVIFIGSKRHPSNKTIAQFFNGTKIETEKWYGTKYLVKNLDSKFLNKRITMK